MSVRKFHDLEALSRAAAEFFVRRAREAITDSGRFTVALAGGNTPKALYALLATEPYRNYVEWQKVIVFFGDERFVPASDPSSNEHTAREFLLSKVPIEPSQVHSMYMETSPEEAAVAYEAQLRAVLGDRGLDLCLLGMGDDGHTASLFPGIPELEETKKWVVPTISPKGVPQRLSLTVPELAKSHTLLFLAAGSDKAEPLKAALTAAAGSMPPAGVVAKAAHRAVWYVDDAAAAFIADLCEKE